jgi:hypothetical protein
MRAHWSFVFFFAVSMALTATPVPADTNLEARKAAYDAVLKDPYDDTLFKAYLDALPKTTNPFAPGEPVYLVEGDIPKTAKQIRPYLIARSNEPATTGAPNPELKLHVDLGRPTFWDKALRTIRYTVWRESFPDEAKYKTTVKAMEEATKDWVDACPVAQCGLTFVYVKDMDKTGTKDPNEAYAKYGPKLQLDELRFFVYYREDAPENVYAAAFFPNAETTSRSLWLGDAFYNIQEPGLTARGILRHELGHVLGYRHEHIRNVPGCPPELEELYTVDVTPYDGQSVMHYPCGSSKNKGDDVLTTLDQEGHRRVYSLTRKEPLPPVTGKTK